MKWSERKLEVLETISEAGITNKEAIKLLLFVERRMNSAHNCLQRGRTFFYAVDLYSGNDWIEAMEQLGNGNYCGEYYCDDQPYREQWVKYCDAAGYVFSFGLGDAIC
jgi:hypothetical protein